MEARAHRQAFICCANGTGLPIGCCGAAPSEGVGVHTVRAVASLGQQLQ